MKQNSKRSVCHRCDKFTDSNEILNIDGLGVCVECVYGKAKPFELYPIGVVKNNLQRRKKGFGVDGIRGVSRIELFASQKPFLYKLEDEKNITVIYYLHESDSVTSVFNRGLDGKKVGVFASRTPYRLSKIGVQDVTLLKIEGTTLFVEGLDAVNGTPVLDIKMSWRAL
ncbi:MAG: TrmO family methyltransferase [Candidatus Theseobacter exili]|nr:TrmO family methyltransferase [Candidatus Theseobacter exili]